MSRDQIGVINEIGDMGLGFDVLTEQEQNKVRNDKYKNRNNQSRKGDKANKSNR